MTGYADLPVGVRRIIHHLKVRGGAVIVASMADFCASVPHVGPRQVERDLAAARKRGLATTTRIGGGRERGPGGGWDIRLTAVAQNLLALDPFVGTVPDLRMLRGRVG